MARRGRWRGATAGPSTSSSCCGGCTLRATDGSSTPRLIAASPSAVTALPTVPVGCTLGRRPSRAPTAAAPERSCEGGVMQPLRRDRVTVASRIMLPAYVMHFAWVGLTWTFAGEALVRQTASLAYADSLV